MNIIDTLRKSKEHSNLPFYRFSREENRYHYDSNRLYVLTADDLLANDWDLLIEPPNSESGDSNRLASTKQLEEAIAKLQERLDNLEAPKTHPRLGY